MPITPSATSPNDLTPHQLEAEKAAQHLLGLANRLFLSPRLKKGKTWSDKWPGWEKGKNWEPEKNGVYVLWKNAADAKKGVPPLYVGEGHLGPRIWESFRNRPTWEYVQMVVTDDQTSDQDNQARFWRKTLERFAIVVLKPTDNKD